VAQDREAIPADLQPRASVGVRVVPVFQIGLDQALGAGDHRHGADAPSRRIEVAGLTIDAELAAIGRLAHVGVRPPPAHPQADQVRIVALRWAYRGPPVGVGAVLQHGGLSGSRA